MPDKIRESNSQISSIKNNQVQTQLGTLTSLEYFH